MSEAEHARTALALSHAELGRRVGLSGSQVGRMLRGDLDDVGLVRVSELLALLGLDLAIRAYPTGNVIRDRGQLALLERLHARLDGRLRWRVEVPVIELATAGEIDLRAWDAAIDGRGWTTRVDAETRLRDVQELTRRIALKQRDSRVDTVILLLSDTVANRAAIRLAGSSLSAGFPVATRSALLRLGRGQPIPGNALIVL